MYSCVCVVHTKYAHTKFDAHKNNWNVFSILNIHYLEFCLYGKNMVVCVRARERNRQEMCESVCACARNVPYIVADLSEIPTIII